MLILSILVCWFSPERSGANVKVDGICYRLYSETNTAMVSGNETLSGDVVIPESIVYDGITYSVNSIDAWAFSYQDDRYNSPGLTSVTIPNSVTSIGILAFARCINLKTVKIGSGLNFIGDEGSPFAGCTSLTSIIVDSDNKTYDSRDNCNAIIETSTNTLVVGCGNTIIPNSVKSIGEYAFSRFTGLTSIEIPNSVTSIGHGAFYLCTDLTSIEIPNSVTSIGGYAFYRCTGLTSIEIPSCVTSIDAFAFSDCTGLTSIEIPSCVTSIGYSAFTGCTGLTSIEIPSSVTSIGGSAFSSCTSLTSIEIPSSVTSIGDEAFSSCTSLSSIIVASNNSNYDSRENCNAIIETSTNTLIQGCLTSIAIPNSVTSIGAGAFSGCTGLTSIAIPNGVTSICGSAFKGCTGLSSIEIPNSVTSIGSHAFYGCKGLNSIEIPNSVTSIGSSAFYGCTGLTSIEIPSSVTSIGSSAFSGCTGLTSIAIPSSVTSIGSFAFSGCTGLTSIEIPNSVTSIGSWAFCGCTGLSSITVGWETPLTIYSSVFSNVDKTACTLYVPFGTKSAYENAEVWSDFQNIVELNTDLSALTNAIYVNQTEGRIGGTMDIPVNIKSSYPVRGFQFAMELPEGTIINSWALSTDRLPSGATTSDKIAAQNITGNKITVACSLNYGTAAFTGNDGVVATINVTFPDDMEPGSYPIYLTACDVNDASGKDEDLSDVKATLILEDYLPGDANGDGKVRIGDATTILNYIVGSVSDNFKEKAADANGDGKIRIGDSTTILNIIVNQ